LEIIYLNSVDSTHTYLKKYIKDNGYTKPLAVVTHHQTNGIGSRDNSWDGLKGNLFFSFVIHKSLLPDDLPLSSTSIYFSYLLKEILKDAGSNLWLKWPNDFYMGDKKLGGTITNLSGELLYCGIGINLLKVSDEFGFLDISYDKLLLEEYLSRVTKKIEWKRIFSKFSLEFEKSKQFKTTIDNEKVELSSAILNMDGSISINNKKVFSLR
jgi:BirA family biotin operon repressor/biotin-[acetyl-CoA-carboxylase] ligase